MRTKCSNNGGNMRLDQFVEEIKEQLKPFGVKEVTFEVNVAYVDKIAYLPLEDTPSQALTFTVSL